MCRSIKVLHGFEPPTTAEEVREAATQFVRKVSGFRHPSREAAEAFKRAVAEVSSTTERLLNALPTRPIPRTREAERAKARLRAAHRSKISG